MRTLLIITTINDLSIPLFLTYEIRNKIGVDFCFFHENTKTIQENLKSNKYNYIYIRDPFNYTFNAKDIERKVNTILANAKNSYIVDNIKSLEDIYFEDKWKQYQLFAQFMPKTAILEKLEDVGKQDLIAKKRISSRAKGIVFHSKSLAGKNLSNYIIQKKVEIIKEYRVYVIFDKIIERAALKRSKTKDSKVAIYDSEKLSPPMIDFVKKIINKNKFDFIGLDIAKSKEKSYLLEINRSCLFNGYFRNTGINLAETFVNGLLKKKSPSVSHG